MPPLPPCLGVFFFFFFFGGGGVFEGKGKREEGRGKREEGRGGKVFFFWQVGFFTFWVLAALVRVLPEEFFFFKKKHLD